ncbi:DNA gyrase subunit A [Ruminococcaceae bacterium OttesenSCG-928-L11]|nr:DNA gyrase subunit A [Ruminococcaceae bacterium OttesenSCG-928-L11]
MNDEERIIQVDIEDEMKKSFLDYSMSVIVSRALPDVRDGLKPVHRRILYTMHENNLTPERAYRKCADTVGSVLGRYHPHGDASVYDALVRLAQDFSLRYPLVDGHGNFGSIDGDPAAAYRYTEAKMTRMSVNMLTDIDKETVDYRPNYDDRLQEPVVLPSRFPNLLVNGSMGIAVGMATNIPPHNLGEVIDGVNLLMDNPDATLEELMECIKGPDFPTAGIIMGRAGIRSAYATGRGKIILRGRAEIKENEKSGRSQIVVTELPYNVNKARLIEHIADLVKDKRIEGISNIADHSDRNGMEILIDLKRDANAQVVLNQLYTFSQLQSTEGVIMLALHDGKPKIMSLQQMLQHYIDFQCEVIERRTRYDLRKAKERAHILDGLLIAQDNIDEVINIFRTSATTPIAKDRLIERFSLSEEQAQAIAMMTMSRLTGLEREKLETELAELKVKIAEYEEILRDHSRVLAVIREELEVIRKRFGDERRTEIATVSGEVDIEDLIPVEDCVITLTHYGYLKSQPVDTYKTQRRGGRGISGMSQREEDFVEELFIASTHDYIMFFTSRGRCFRIKAYEIGESSRAARGTNVVNLLPIDSEEKITAMIKVSQYDDDAYLVMVTRSGIIKRTHLSAYRNVRKNGLNAIHLMEGDELRGVRLTTGENELILATRNGMAIRFNEQDARELGRTARGVRAIRLKNGDEVIGLAKVRENGTLLTVSERGKGRRSEIDQYRLQSRGGKGIKNYDTEKNGYVAGIKIVDDEDDVILISDNGIIIRIPVDQINVQSRYGSGVRVMRLEEDHRVVTLARSPKEEESEESADAEGEATETETTQESTTLESARQAEEADAGESVEE